MNSQLELKFITYNLNSYVSTCLDIIKQGKKRILLRPFNRFAADFIDRLSDHYTQVKFYVKKEECEGPLPENAELLNGDAITMNAVFFFISEAKDLSSHLMDCLELERCFIVAPITQHYYKNKPVFLISIPKSGTHLLYRLCEIFGYKPGIILDDEPSPGKWYCLEYSNSHTSAKDFFIDTVRRSPFGNRHHPFPSTPAIFIYRNPLDILVSEANYYHKDGNTVFHGYLNNRSFEERLLTLIDDPWLLGSIRDRIGNFVPWLEFQNIIPISFEEIVGEKGGGLKEEQMMLIWSLQLKLHIPGDPQYFSEKVFDKDSPTFLKGQIGSFKKYFTEKAYDKYYDLPQDFVKQLGYDFDDPKADHLIPKRSKEFRARPLVYSGVNYKNTAILIESSYLNHNIVKYGSLYYGIPTFCGKFSMVDQTDFILKLLPSDSDLLKLKLKLINRRKIPSLCWKMFWFIFLDLKHFLKCKSKKNGLIRN
jgi:hypothetical protein